MLRKIEELREDINKMIETMDYDNDELLEKSQELDRYIVKFMKRELDTHKNLK